MMVLRVCYTNREFANTYGLKPLARVIGIASAGVEQIYGYRSCSGCAENFKKQV